MSLRPFNWFEKHFEKALDIKLEDMEYVDKVFRYSDDTGDFFAFRYEDMGTALPNCLKIAGVDAPGSIKKRNVSASKPYASEVKRAFSSQSAAKLNYHFKQSNYSRVFGYSA
jgi:hypothetical protein